MFKLWYNLLFCYASIGLLWTLGRGYAVCLEFLESFSFPSSNCVRPHRILDLTSSALVAQSIFYYLVSFHYLDQDCFTLFIFSDTPFWFLDTLFLRHTVSTTILRVFVQVTYWSQRAIRRMPHIDINHIYVGQKHCQTLRT